MLKIQNLIDTAKCYETVRQLRWAQGVTCPHCASQKVTKRGRDETQPEHGNATSVEPVGGSLMT